MPAFGPSFLFGLGEGAILPVIALTVRQLGGSVALAALMVTLIGIGSLVTNIPASLITDALGRALGDRRRRRLGRAGMALCVLAPNLGRSASACFMVGMSAAVFGLARQSYLTEAVPFRYRARALSTLGGVMRIGLFLGPFVAAAADPRAWASAAPTGPASARSCSSAVVAARMPDLPAHAAGASAERSCGRAARRRCARSARGHAKIFLTVGIGALLVSAVRASRQAVIPLWAEASASTPRRPR